MIKHFYNLLKGANKAMMREYVTPDFDVTVYEIEDVITVSIGGADPDEDSGNGTGWWG